jgi:hypothetical protein
LTNDNFGGKFLYWKELTSFIFFKGLLLSRVAKLELLNDAFDNIIAVSLPYILFRQVMIEIGEDAHFRDQVHMPLISLF